jgi:hypothetical protein
MQGKIGMHEVQIHSAKGNEVIVVIWRTDGTWVDKFKPHTVNGESYHPFSKIIAKLTKSVEQVKEGIIILQGNLAYEYGMELGRDRTTKTAMVVGHGSAELLAVRLRAFGVTEWNPRPALGGRFITVGDERTNFGIPSLVVSSENVTRGLLPKKLPPTEAICQFMLETSATEPGISILTDLVNMEVQGSKHGFHPIVLCGYPSAEGIQIRAFALIAGMPPNEFLTSIVREMETRFAMDRVTVPGLFYFPPDYRRAYARHSCEAFTEKILGSQVREIEIVRVDGTSIDSV